MLTARITASLFATILSVGLVVGCGGESKPAAKTPTSEGQPKTAAKAAPDAKDKPASADKADPGPGKVKVVEGKAPGGDDRYALEIEPPADATKGQEGQVMVRVVPKKPWHMNLDFPTSLKVEPPPGVELANASLKKGDALTLDDDSCVFAVKFTPSEAGDHAFSGKFKFAVCQDDACSPVTEDVSFKVAVK